MGEIVDIKKDLTTHNLSISQKLSVIWETMIADSKILGKRKKAEEEHAAQKRNETYDALKDGILASLAFHLQENSTLYEYNQEAEEVQLAVDRAHYPILKEVLNSHEFNVYDWIFVDLDADIVNSFGEIMPLIVSFRQKEVWS